MRIETKFCPGDSAYYFSDSNYKLRKITIDRVEIVAAGSVTKIWYYDANNIAHAEEIIFATIKEAKDYLISIIQEL